MPLLDATPPAHAVESRAPVSQSEWLGLLAVAFGLACVTALSYVQRPGQPDFALFWPSAGVGLALALRFGVHGLLATALGVGVWAWWFVNWSWAAVVWSAVAAAVGPAWVWHQSRARWAEVAQPLERLPTLLAFLRQQVGGSTAAATVGSVGLWVTGHWPPGVTPLEGWTVYWLLETCGSWLFAPVAIWLTRTDKSGRAPARLRPWLAAVWAHRVGILFTLVLTATVVGLLVAGRFDWAQAALYGLLPLLVLLALRAPPFLIHTLLMGAGGLVLFTLAYLKRQPVWAGNDTLSLTLILYLLAGSGVLLVVAASMAERRRSEQRLAQAALVDPLTGLGNEAGLLQRLEAAAESGLPVGHVQMLMSVSQSPSRQRRVDGRLSGLYTLDRDMADRLRSVPTPVWWARTSLGGFRGLWRGPLAQQAAVLNGVCGVCAQAPSATGVASWAVAAAVAGPDLARRCPGQTQLGLLAQAEFRAHQFRRVELVDITAETVDAVRRETQLADRVREAIDRRTLTLVAQPIAANVPAAGRLPKAEVLVRLSAPDGTRLSPGEFLPAAMRAGLMAQLDHAVLAMTLEAMARSPNPQGARCAVNLSGPTVMDDQLVTRVASLLAHYGLPADRLVLEVTESMAMSDLDSAAQTLAGLRRLGCQVAIDDFGTGMATFDYLKRFPVDTVKIDGSFIQPLADGEGVDRVIVDAMIRVARALNLTTVAEYVSSDAVWAQVRGLGIDESQGYAIAPPVPLDEWLRSL